jgi:hypothetical protein
MSFVTVDPSGPNYIVVSFTRQHNGCITSISVDSLNQSSSSVRQQFALIKKHIRKEGLPAMVFVVRNRGLEAEYHRDASSSMAGVRFYEANHRAGVLVTWSMKNAALEYFNLMLQTKQVHLTKDLDCLLLSLAWTMHPVFPFELPAHTRLHPDMMCPITLEPMRRPMRACL